MSDDVSRLFGRAVEAMVKAVLVGKDVHYGRVTKSDPNLTYPYLVIWVIPATRRRVNLTGSAASPDARVQLTAVGRSPDEVTWTLDRAGDALQGKKAAVDGHRSGRIWEMPVEQAVTKNEDLFTTDGSPTYRGVSMFRLALEKAPESGS